MAKKTKTTILVLLAAGVLALVMVAAYALFMVFTYTGQEYYLPLLAVTLLGLMIMIPASFFQLFKGKLCRLWGLLLLLNLIYVGLVMAAFPSLQQ